MMMMMKSYLEEWRSLLEEWERKPEVVALGGFVLMPFLFDDEEKRS